MIDMSYKYDEQVDWKQVNSGKVRLYDPRILDAVAESRSLESEYSESREHMKEALDFYLYYILGEKKYIIKMLHDKGYKHDEIAYALDVSRPYVTKVLNKIDSLIEKHVAKADEFISATNSVIDMIDKIDEREMRLNGR